ncbi:hypothetical protein B0H10DRAFT_2054808, partial [Mycena sp. CBHHK59/15]
MPRVLGISEGEGTAPGPSVDTDKAEKRTPGFAMDDEPSVRRSSAPLLRCTTTCCADLCTSWTQSKPRTKSQGKEAVTGTSRRRIEMTPALQGSVSGSESWEPRVGIPELITQSRETQELAA